jgi:hypothetical protein
MSKTQTLQRLTTKLQKEHGQPTSQVPVAAEVADVQLDLRSLLEANEATVEVDLAACPTVSFTLKKPTLGDVQPAQQCPPVPCPRPAGAGAHQLPPRR